MSQAIQAAKDAARHPVVAFILGILAALAVKIGALDSWSWSDAHVLFEPKAVSDWLSLLVGMLPPLFARMDAKAKPEAPVKRRRSATVRGLVLALAALALATGCATSTDARLVQAIEAGAIVHHETMVAAGAAAERGVITEEKLERIAAVGRDVEAALRTARVVVDLYLAAKQAGTGSQGSAAASVAVADLEAALVELARVAAGVRR